MKIYDSIILNSHFVYIRYNYLVNLINIFVFVDSEYNIDVQI